MVLTPAAVLCIRTVCAISRQAFGIYCALLRAATTSYTTWTCHTKWFTYRETSVKCIQFHARVHHSIIVNTLRLRQDGRHFSDDIFKCIFLDENIWISIKILLKFVPKGPINNILALVQIMAWRRAGDKPLSEPMMVRLPMHICVTRPQWVKLKKLIKK